MKTDKIKLLICLLFFGFLFAMMAAFLLLPHGDYSENEKRYLADAPVFNWQSLSSGEFSEDAESYVADHLPLRDFFVGLAANYDRLSGRQVTKDIYVGDSGRLYEAPVEWNESAARRNMSVINDFALTVGQRVDIMIVPSAGYVLNYDISGLADPYRDGDIIASIYAMAEGGVTPVNILGLFTSYPDPYALYYGTDHHWTSLGAYNAYSSYMDAAGRSALPRECYSVTAVEGFYGTTYSRSALWQYHSETIELWDSGQNITVTAADDTTHEGVFYSERLEETDKYTVYLDGNQPIVRIHNADAEGEGSILVIRDSYANCLGGFLAGSYENVVLVDLRYYKQPISQLCEEEHFDDILIVYSVGNFMSDGNIVLLE